MQTPTTRLNVADKGVYSDKIFGQINEDRKKYFDHVMKDKTKGITEQIIEICTIHSKKYKNNWR